MELNIEKLQYIWAFMEDWICQAIDDVLNDSAIDPHHSAVSTSNLIKCFIEISEQLGRKLPYSDARSFFSHNAYTSDEWDAFEKHRAIESTYYRGVQY